MDYNNISFMFYEKFGYGYCLSLRYHGNRNRDDEY